ncbi:hypothetical protein ABIE13_005594 [Ottowia thiooxydans]|uniref:Uncharacterized protein n=1 Tax=Ottowia thiooxydans TaxID=219182 RepID=A0ABV2QIU4_9BURK
MSGSFSNFGATTCGAATRALAGMAADLCLRGGQWWAQLLAVAATLWARRGMAKPICGLASILLLGWAIYTGEIQ